MANSIDLDKWAEGIDEERRFWDRWLKTKGDRWPDDYLYRINPYSEVKQPLRGYLTNIDGVPSVLDVGAGPMTSVGKMYKGAKIDLTAVDALADIYEKLDFPIGLPIIRTEKCYSESLSEKFPVSFFDICHASNTLDHSIDPVKSFLEMLKVTKLNGFLVTSHAANEANNESWRGFHQWNLSSIGNDLLIANSANIFSLKNSIEGIGEIVDISPAGSDWVDCIIKKI